MPRQPLSSYRLGSETKARLARLVEHMELSDTDVIRQAIRRLHDAELDPAAGAKKSRKKPVSGTDRVHTSG